MRVEERGNVLTARTTPGCVWLFGLWFVAGGTLAMVATFAASNAHEVPWWARVFAFFAGAACAAAGIGVIVMAPAIRAVFDRTSGRAVVTTIGVGKRTRVEFACRDVCVVDVKQEKDGDGDPMYQIRIWLRDGRAIPLQPQPVHGREWAAVHADAIRRFLGIRVPRAYRGSLSASTGLDFKDALSRRLPASNAPARRCSPSSCRGARRDGRPGCRTTEQRQPSQRITDEVTSWPEVEAGPGARGEFAFTVGGREIGHLHGDQRQRAARPGRQPEHDLSQAGESHDAPRDNRRLPRVTGLIGAGCAM